jgi:hypothetical protein
MESVGMSVDQRLLQCPAGHQFCHLCWSTQVTP